MKRETFSKLMSEVKGRGKKEGKKKKEWKRRKEKHNGGGFVALKWEVN